MMASLMGGGGHMVKKSYHKIGRWFWEEDCSGEGEYQWFWEEDKKEIVQENIRLVSERVGCDLAHKDFCNLGGGLVPIGD